MGKTIVKPWVKVFGVIVVVAGIVFGLYSLGQNGTSNGKSFEMPFLSCQFISFNSKCAMFISDAPKP